MQRKKTRCHVSRAFWFFFFSPCVRVISHLLAGRENCQTFAPRPLFLGEHTWSHNTIYVTKVTVALLFFSFNSFSFRSLFAVVSRPVNACGPPLTSEVLHVVNASKRRGTFLYRYIYIYIYT